MNNHLPSISVIIPVYNAEQYLAEALESVLEQSYPPSEIIIVNDGSSDRSRVVAESFVPQVSVLHQSNQGISAARNLGIREAQGDYLAFIDADDIWLKDKLQDQIKVFKQDENVDVVYGHARQFYSPDLPQEIKEKLLIRQQILPAHVACAMLIKRRAFMRVGLFSTSLVVGVDQDWYIRAKDTGLNSVLLPQILFMRRIHEGNQGRRMKHLTNTRLHILKAAIDRRRKEES